MIAETPASPNRVVLSAAGRVPSLLAHPISAGKPSSVLPAVDQMRNLAQLANCAARRAVKADHEIAAVAALFPQTMRID
jgi:hypothetical protein